MTQTLSYDEARRVAPALYGLLAADAVDFEPGSIARREYDEAFAELAALADRRTMGRAEVAECLGVRPTNLRYQYGLPEPFARHRSGPVWWAREVEAYKAKRDGEQDT